MTIHRHAGKTSILGPQWSIQISEAKDGESVDISVLRIDKDTSPTELSVIHGVKSSGVLVHTHKRR